MDINCRQCCGYDRTQLLTYLNKIVLYYIEGAPPATPQVGQIAHNNTPKVL